MILKAENILGGTLLTLHWEQAAHKTQAAAVLNANDVRLLADAIGYRKPYDRGTDLSVVWNIERDIANVLIGADSITIPIVQMFALREHLNDRNKNETWQFGAQL